MPNDNVHYICYYILKSCSFFCRKGSIDVLFTIIVQQFSARGSDKKPIKPDALVEVIKKNIVKESKKKGGLFDDYQKNPGSMGASAAVSIKTTTPTTTKTPTTTTNPTTTTTPSTTTTKPSNPVPSTHGNRRFYHYTSVTVNGNCIRVGHYVLCFPRSHLFPPAASPTITVVENMKHPRTSKCGSTASSSVKSPTTIAGVSSLSESNNYNSATRRT